MANEVPYEITKVSDLPDEKEEKIRVMMLDKKLPRKVEPGEEDNIEDIARTEGTLDADVETLEPGGTATISGPTVTKTTVLQAIARDFGATCRGGLVIMSDGYYFLYSTREIEKVLSEDLTDVQMWINTYFDCDDFSQVVAGAINQQLKGIPFGILWYRGPGVYHAVNCFYSKEEKKMKVVEPQTDRIYDFNKSKYCPMLVVI
jgi:hypothetical protein